MRLQRWCLILLGGTLFSLAVIRWGAAEPSPQDPALKPEIAQKADPEREAILENAKAFMEAYNRQDVKALMPLFTKDCEITELDGTVLRGRKEIEEALTDFFKENPQARISLSLDTVRRLNDTAAIEDGTSVFFPDGKTATTQSHYQVVHIKQDGRWLMANARTYNQESLTPYEHLRDLEWLIGDWIDESPDAIVETSYRWAENKTFLLQEFTVRVKGRSTLKGSARIGWDPLAKHIRSWIFDSEGGFGEGHWSLVDDTWVIKAKGVSDDGKVVTTTNHLTQVSRDRMNFVSVDRIVGDERIPGLAAAVVRKPPQPKR
ncbi:MAG: SgcJ/EcaC family oxidoreductase [Gemmataceae bacterium]|nr:SgcJ/EcaC family oxidoreductase [Gemmataceae bacterium]